MKTPRNSFSERPPDIVDNISSHYGTEFIPLGHIMPWNQITQSCPLDSPARQMNGVDLTTSYAHGPFGFIYNTTAFSDVCNQASLPYRHGFFDRPTVLNLYNTLLPIFSAAKVSTFTDILMPSSAIYGNLAGSVSESQDIDWELKKNQMHWRGSTTGGYATIGGMTRHHSA